MTIAKAIATIAGCTMLVASIGGGVGYGLGALAPGYYRSVFRTGREPWFDPVAVGLGQGLTQGTVGGIAVGLALVAILCWRETRLRQPAGSAAHQGIQTGRTGVIARRLLLFTGGLLTLGLCFSSGMVFGLFGGESGAYQRRFVEERDALVPVLAGDPAFAGVEIHQRSDGGVYLTGEVPTPRDLVRLRDLVIRAIGETRAKEALPSVGVSQARQPADLP